MSLIAVTPRGFRHTAGRHVDLLQSSGFEVRYSKADRPLNADELTELLTGCEGVILGVDHCPAMVIRAHRGLRVIVRFGIGMDNVDLDAAVECGIRVSRTPGVTSSSVAELAIALLLAAARGIPALDRGVRGGSWTRLPGLEVAGRTLGLVGVGHIGREVAWRASALGLTVIAHDPFVAAGPIALVSFDELIARSDLISIHAPLTDSTRNMFNADVLSKMRPNSILVNTARGGIVDEAALADALSDGPLRAAAFDSFAEEPLDGESPLRRCDNVILTPHSGASTIEAVERAGVLAVEELLRGLRGDPMLHEVAPYEPD